MLETEWSKSFLESGCGSGQIVAQDTKAVGSILPGEQIWQRQTCCTEPCFPQDPFPRASLCPWKTKKLPLNRQLSTVVWSIFRLHVIAFESTRVACSVFGSHHLSISHSISIPPFFTTASWHLVNRHSCLRHIAAPHATYSRVI